LLGYLEPIRPAAETRRPGTRAAPVSFAADEDLYGRGQRSAIVLQGTAMENGKVADASDSAVRSGQRGAGRKDIGQFLATRVLTAPAVFTAVPAAANGQPALAIYRRAYGVQVLTLRASRIAGVVAFLDPGLFPAFGLPSELPAAGQPVARGW
jgi:hypothetical protein